MDYRKHYNYLISKAKDRILEVEIYTESHHIIPKSEGGKDVQTNLVNLTAREHFIAHWLLYREDPLNSKRAFAFWRMCNGQGKIPSEKWYIPSSRAYEEGKLAWRDNMKHALKGRKKSKDHVAKVAAANRGKIRSLQARKNMSKAAKKRGIPPGYYKMVESRKVQDKRQEKTVYMLDVGTGEVIKEFSSLKLASKSVNRNPSNISVAIKKQTTSAGFKWKYKN